MEEMGALAEVHLPKVAPMGKMEIVGKIKTQSPGQGKVPRPANLANWLGNCMPVEEQPRGMVKLQAV
jgi:hypothetical protein